MNGLPYAPVAPPSWISKPLHAMTHDELRDLRDALCRESPPDHALLRAIDGRLAGSAAPPPAEDTEVKPEAEPDSEADSEVEPEAEADSEAESDDWALDG
ncbi:hypothetical protein GCM10023085_11730 [Actinomadura viridis]|uniref:Uncharacterized protein n=1 Tax=Actinomadura viridis TaxID=58110 RepID=A0A931DRR1_9ACTN|nr:hypothetical protein [Actinomadura viridis]MBG6093549.1 hypothetical protein [Actinomadura viridis]